MATCSKCGTVLEPCDVRFYKWCPKCQRFEPDPCPLEDKDISCDYNGPCSDCPYEETVKNTNPLIQWRVYDGVMFAPEGEVTLKGKIEPAEYEMVKLGFINVFRPILPVSDDLVRIENSSTNTVLSEIEKFWTLREKFKQHGMTHKRGFLLYGPPGSGKTSTIRLVAERVVTSGGVVIHCNRSAGTLTGMLKAMREIEPNRKILVIMEDVDEKVAQDETGLLALLDGEASIDGVVYLATTNYLKRLPARIRNRPSRFDRLIRIGKPDFAYRRVYLESRRLGLEGAELDKWAKDTAGLSIAHIKEVVVAVRCLEIPYEEALARVRAMSSEAELDDSEETADENGQYAAEDPLESLRRALNIPPSRTGSTGPQFAPSEPSGGLVEAVSPPMPCIAGG